MNVAPFERFEIVTDSLVTRRLPTDANPVAAGPRCVRLGGGELIASYMVQTKLGSNDFVPMLSRSSDGGATWGGERPAFPHLVGKWSMFCSISRSHEGELFLYGSLTRIAAPGETFWSDATMGLKQNELFWSSSRDRGRTWSEPSIIPMRIPGSAEAPGAMCVTRGERWVAVYSPYNTFDPKLKVDLSQVVAMRSHDRGRTWRHSSMLRFTEPDSGGAEAWCVELSDGRLLGAAWHTNMGRGENKVEYPNKFALSSDAGMTWSPTRSTGTMGHTVNLAPLDGGAAVFCYVKRSPAEDIGLWIAHARPSDADFNITSHAKAWGTDSAGRKSAAFEDWTSFNFGEPSVVVMDDGTLLLLFWYAEKEHAGVRCLRLRGV